MLPCGQFTEDPRILHETPSEDSAHKIFKLHNVFLRKINTNGLYSGLSLKPQETA